MYQIKVKNLYVEEVEYYYDRVGCIINNIYPIKKISLVNDFIEGKIFADLSEATSVAKQINGQIVEYIQRPI